MPAVAVTVGGVAVTLMAQDSLVIEAVIGQTVDVARLTIYDATKGLSPDEGDDLIITRTDTGALLFGGILALVTGRPDGPFRWWDLAAQDYTILLDRILFKATYPSGSSDRAIIQDLFTNQVVGPGGGVGAASEITVLDANIAIGLASMAALYFDKYPTAREVMEQLAGYVGYSYHVDYSKALHYYFQEANAAPYALSDAPDGVVSVGYGNLRWKRDGSHLVNNYILIGPNLFSDVQTFAVASNGVATVINLGASEIGRNYTLAAPPGYARIRVDVNTGTDGVPIWTAQDVGADHIDTIPPMDVLHDAVSKTLTFAVAPPNFTNSVRVRAVYPYNSGQAIGDAASYAKYGRWYSGRFVAGDVNSATALAQKLARLQRQYTTGLEILTCTVEDTQLPVGATTAFAPGQWVYLTNSALDLSARGYLIHRVTTRILGGSKLVYELELRNWVTAGA